MRHGCVPLFGTLNLGAWQIVLMDTYTQTVNYLENEVLFCHKATRAHPSVYDAARSQLEYGLRGPQNLMVTDLDGVTWQFPSGTTIFRGRTPRGSGANNRARQPKSAL
jgi:hypothetical protein